jgi:uncharacterized protein (UPF0276 family)
MMADESFRLATLPLFEAGVVDVLEWSFEIGWRDGEPPWVTALLDHYAHADRLFGHGVTYSPLSVAAADRHATWIDRVAHECTRRSYRGVSEHYGFMGNDGLDLGAPLPMPPIAETVDAGRDALARLAAVARAPVGLENLALAFGNDDVWAQGELIEQMLAPFDGYLVLDVHNLHCQVENFGADPSALLDSYPLSRVRCIHVSGGSWSEHDAGRFRRDTHDDALPDGALDLLALALPRCPALEAVIVERIGPTLTDPAAQVRLREDVYRVRALVEGT